MSPIRLVIAEDYMALRYGLQTMLAAYPDAVEVVGDARNFDETMRQITTHQPDAVLFDLCMPRRQGSLNKGSWEDGVAALRRLTEQMPHVRVLVLSNHKEQMAIVGALNAGADGYLAKGDEFEGDLLVDALRRIMQGELVYGPSIQHAVQRLQSAKALLTKREEDVFALLLEGASNTEIAERLFIEITTVKTHVRNILGKLGVAHRSAIPWRIQVDDTD